MHATSPGEDLIASLEPSLRHGDSVKVDLLLSAHPPAECEAALREIAARALQAKHWALLQSSLGRLVERDVAAQLQFNLARNMVALQEHRPSVYEAVMRSPSDARFEIACSATGLPTIFFSTEPGNAVSFSNLNDPLKSVGAIFSQLKPDIDRGAAIALCGLGDGYLLNAIAQKPPQLYMTMQATVHVVEAHAQVLMLCMMIHDYTADTGPIKQQRFRWYVGPQWRRQFEEEMLGDLLTPFPSLTINQGIDADRITKFIERVTVKSNADDDKRRIEIEGYYAGVSQDAWINAFSSFPNRQPRVLLITTRFSTVLQYSTGDAAQAFGQLGWETKLIIEPSDWQRMGTSAVRKSLAEFKPDFVFQIDHLRHEHGNMYPSQLPFACWIQDHLPNLCNAEAGAAVGARDFVLSGMGSLFVQQHHYPRRQVIDLPQLSRIPMRPTEWVSDGDDIIYVSNWSKPADQVVTELLASFSEPPALRSLIEACSGEIVRRYAAGETVSTHYDVRLILTDCEVAAGVQISATRMKDEIINGIFDRLNNTLYRHQALEWTADVAKSMGLNLALYGRGWDQHPAFAAHARGPVAAGEALELLTRQSKINLQLEPYACFSHARLLSGLFAGGFFLIRDNPFNHLTQELLNFVDRHFDSVVCSVPQARDSVKEHHRDGLEEILARCACLGEQVDPIGMVRDWQRGGTLVPQAIALPRLHDVLFDSRDSLEQLINRYINNAELRYDISTEQRQNTQSRLSYRAGLDRVVRAIGKLIAAEPFVGKSQAA